MKGLAPEEVEVAAERGLEDALDEEPPVLRPGGPLLEQEGDGRDALAKPRPECGAEGGDRALRGLVGQRPGEVGEGGEQGEALDGRREERLLRREVEVDRALGEAGLAGDRLDPGGVEAVATIKTICESKIPATINLENPDPECDLDYVPNKYREANVDVAISSNLGFGGHNAAVAFRKYKGV